MENHAYPVILHIKVQTKTNNRTITENSLAHSTAVGLGGRKEFYAL